MKQHYALLNLDGDFKISHKFYSLRFEPNEKKWQGIKVGNDGYPEYL